MYVHASNAHALACVLLHTAMPAGAHTAQSLHEVRTAAKAHSANNSHAIFIFFDLTQGYSEIRAVGSRRSAQQEGGGGGRRREEEEEWR